VCFTLIVRIVALVVVHRCCIELELLDCSGITQHWGCQANFAMCHVVIESHYHLHSLNSVTNINSTQLEQDRLTTDRRYHAMRVVRDQACIEREQCLPVPPHFHFPPTVDDGITSTTSTKPRSWTSTTTLTLSLQVKSKLKSSSAQALGIQAASIPARSLILKRYNTVDKQQALVEDVLGHASSVVAADT
jgi:hypothetical protein